MLRCLVIKRKLYDYLDNSLSEADKIGVKKHLDVCSSCTERLSQMRNVLELATQEKMPQLDNEFWHSFKIDLDRKLNERIVPPFVFERKLKYHLSPVLAYAFVLVFILTIGIYYYKDYSFNMYLAKEEKSLVDEIAMLEEIGGVSYLNHNEDTYIEELNLLYEFNQELT